MPSLPLPLVTFVLSIIACGLILRIDFGKTPARIFFTATFALIALGALLIGLRFGYGIETFIPVQRVVPLFIGPSMYLGFSSLAVPSEKIWPRAIHHYGIALALALLPQIAPMFRPGFDLVIMASYLIYGILLLILWRKGNDGLSSAPLRMVLRLRRWMLFAAGMLFLMLIFDGIIALSFARRQFENAVGLISIGSAITLIGLIFAIYVFARNGSEAKSAAAVPTGPPDQHVRTEQAAAALLKDSELFKETDLTLERLAKRLHMPARTLSEAVNQTQGMNMSQYVNGFRLRHAADLLVTSRMSVKDVMERSGFLTRSNFYREFERVYGMTPVAYRKSGPDQ